MIETIITVIVIAIATGVLVPFTQSLKGSANPVLIQQAVTLAQGRMEEIVADRRNRLTPRGFPYATTPTNYPNEAPVAGFAGFDRSVSIVCVTTADFNAPAAAGNAPSPSCTAADGRWDYARVTVTVTNALVGAVTTENLLANH